MINFLNKKHIIILVSGGAASGKTTFSEKLMKLVKNYSVSLVSLDNYYKDFPNLSSEELKNINFDNPITIDSKLLLKHINMLINDKIVKQPKYDFSINAHGNEYVIVKPAKIIIIEGIFLLEMKEIRNLSNIKIYIETDDDIRFIRRLNRDIKERKRSEEFAIKQYLEKVKPMHELIVKPSSRYADLIIPYYEGNDVAMEILISSIKGLLNK